jgi:hypothetical protein
MLFQRYYCLKEYAATFPTVCGRFRFLSVLFFQAKNILAAPVLSRLRRFSFCLQGGPSRLPCKIYPDACQVRPPKPDLDKRIVSRRGAAQRVVFCGNSNPNRDRTALVIFGIRILFKKDFFRGERILRAPRSLSSPEANRPTSGTQIEIRNPRINSSAIILPACERDQGEPMFTTHGRACPNCAIRLAILPESFTADFTR